jgi:hypothetical protein
MPSPLPPLSDGEIHRLEVRLVDQLTIAAVLTLDEYEAELRLLQRAVAELKARRAAPANRG